MALDPVPWFIGSPAEHSAESARQLLWNATGGRTGISAKTDFSVKALGTPSGSVYVYPGGGVIESTYAGATQQSYAVRSAARTTVAVPANNGSSAVTQYVYVEINDPQYAGSAPANPKAGPYNKFGVSTSRTGAHPRLILASIKVPANTSAITNAMITDLREMVSPRRLELVHARPRVASDSGSESFLTSRMGSGGEYFPGGNGSPNTFTVDVPSWASRMIIESKWLSVSCNGGQSSWGQFWIEFGTEYKGDHSWPNRQQWEFATQYFGYDVAEKSAAYRTNWLLADDKAVPAKIKGKTVTFAYKAGINDSANAKSKVCSMDAVSGLTTRILFIEDPETSDQNDAE
ncbi:hypothetical protein [Brevibacterium moorei]|uniref:hypothetical protein n=1 Tax=Brevibacterium moorei TaxID=2968457 RepID=UPI00211C1F23|nr:hypothetical protein [Brevibacterium sp. 68QC2CO]MCQ9385113.1 hypothetical protein [Brevibacterium sp. 68QC2CO]